jgi:uncharacterized membrane protein YkvA (DUF1232 family)
MTAKENFQAAMREAIVMLPQNMKSVMRIVEDPYLGDERRALAAGALIHVLSAHNAIPGQRGTLAYVDDVIILRLVLERLEEEAPDKMETHRDGSPELFQPLQEQLEAVRAFLGERLKVLEDAVATLGEMTHMGHTAQECARDEEASTWLYDAVQEALIRELDFDEDEVERALREVDKIKRPLEQRMLS